MAVAVLCVENERSRSTLSKHLFRTRTYEMVTATSTRSAVIAWKSIPRIAGAVISGIGWDSSEQLRLASELEDARAGLPKVILASVLPVPADMQRIAQLHMSYVGDVQVLAAELQLQLSIKWAECRKAQELRRESRELRLQHREVRVETSRLIQELVERMKRDY